MIIYEKKCPECGEWFEDRELNNYGLCTPCQMDLEIEHQQVIDTQNSLNNL